MRTLFFIIAVSCILSCNTADQPGDVIMNRYEAVELILPRNSWKVEKFIQNGNNYTSEFASIQFHFYEPDSLRAQLKDSSTVVGSWRYQAIPGTIEQLNIDLASPLAKISGEWRILDIMNSEIKLSKSERDTLVFGYFE